MAVGTRLTSKGQVTVPRAIRQRLGVGPGDEVEFVAQEGGAVTLVRSNRAERLEKVFERLRRDPPIKGHTTDEIMALTRGEDR
jgi:antitoxin PrlF